MNAPPRTFAVLLAFFALFTPAVSRADQTVQYSGLPSLWMGGKMAFIRPKDVDTWEGGKRTILESSADLTLHTDGGAVTGRMKIEFRTDQKAPHPKVKGTTSVVTIRRDLEGKFDRDAYLEGPLRGVSLIHGAYSEVRSLDGRESTPRDGWFKGIVWKGTDVTVAGYPELRRDFIILYDIPTPSGGEARPALASAVKAIEQGNIDAWAILWRTSGGGDPAPPTPPDPPNVPENAEGPPLRAGETIGEPARMYWTVSRVIGTAEVRVPGGNWRKLTKGVRIGGGVAFRTAERSTAVLEYRTEGASGEPVTQATQRLAPGSSATIRPPTGPGRPRSALHWGFLVLDADFGDSGGSMTVLTPTAGVTTDGTEFSVEYDRIDKLTTVDVADGKVKVTPTHGELPTKTIGPGDRATVGVREMTLRQGGQSRTFRAEGEPAAEPTGTRGEDEADSSRKKRRSSGDGGWPVWLWLVVGLGGAIVALAVVLVVWLVARRGRRAPPPI